MSSSFRPQAAIAIIAAVLVLVILTGLAGANRSTPPERTGDTYVEAMVGSPRFVNPLLATSDTDTDLSHLVYSGLTRVDTSGNLVPDLASTYSVSPDSKVYTFTLKPDLRWQDGEPLTADDVFFTLGTMLQSPDFPGDPMVAKPWKGVDIKLLGTLSLRFTLPAPDASFLQYTTLGILPRHLWGSTKPAELAGSPYNQSPVGSGPWRYVQAAGSLPSETPVGSAQSSGLHGGVSPGEGVLLEPNPYAPTEGLKVSRIWFRLYPTFGAALTGFKLGEVHGLGHIPEENLADVAAVPGVTLHRQTLARYTMLILNVQSPLFDRVETRQALELAINREELSNEVAGISVPAANPVLSHSWAYDSSVQPSGYDPAQARRLLDQASWTMQPDGVRARDGVTMTVVLAANQDLPDNVSIARHVTDDLRAVGVDARLVLVSRDALLKDYLGPRAFHMVLAGWQASGADPDVYAYWHSSQAVTGGLNFSGWANPVADKALQDGHTISDAAVRKPAYSDFQHAFAADVPAIVLSGPLYTYATRSPASGVDLPHTDMLSAAYRFDTIRNWTLQAP
jgi:peptide/nickel transport system substrate-binding protein